MGRKRLRRKCSKLRTKESKTGGRGRGRLGVRDSNGDKEYDAPGQLW